MITCFSVTFISLVRIMGSMNNPKPWVPYMNSKDCSLGFCSLYCPQWCYIIFSPPPPLKFPDDNSGPNLSPLVIAIIGILATALLLVIYYAIISKYCRNRDSSRRENQYPTEESEENQDSSNYEPWHISSNGLDEALIKSITVFKYKKGEGLTDGTDCSVCLGEFQEDESLRLLPKCNHAFHAMCIDAWLRSHSNCPLCRANIVDANSSAPQLPAVIETPPINDSLSQRHTEIDNAAAEEDIEMGIREGDSHNNIPKTPDRQPSDSDNSDRRSSISNSRDDKDGKIRRSVSMDYLCPGRLSIADILRINEDEEDQMEQHQFPYDVGTSKVAAAAAAAAAEMGRFTNRNRMLHCVANPAAMKRSFSSGRFLLSKHARERNVSIP